MPLDYSTLSGGVLPDDRPVLPRAAPVAGAASIFDIPGVELTNLPPAHMQKRRNTCVPHAGIFANTSVTMAADQGVPDLSYLWLWYFARHFDGSRGNVGVTMRSAAKAWNVYGAIPESLWPYETGEDNFDAQPPREAYETVRAILAPQRPLRGSYEIAAALAGLDTRYPATPVWTSFAVPKSYYTETAVDGLYKRPRVQNTYAELGWHSEAIVAWYPDFAVPGFGLGAFGMIGWWDEHGIAYPGQPDLHRFGFKYVPADAMDDPRLFQGHHAPMGPMMVEASA